MRKWGKLGIEAIYRQLPTWPKYIPRLESSLLWYLGWPEIIFSFLRYKWGFHQLDSCHTETFRDQDNRYSSLGGHWVKYREIPLEDLHYRICVLHHGNMEGKKSIITFLRGTGSPQVVPGWTLFALICTRKSTSHFHLCDFTDITLKNAMRKSIDQMKQRNYLFRWLRTWLEWKARRWQESVTIGKH